MKMRLKTPETLQAEARAAERARLRHAALAYLAETDWMAIRAAETGQPVAAQVARNRADARRRLDGAADAAAAGAPDGDGRRTDG